MHQLPLHHEFMLLALHDEKGNMEGQMPHYGIAGAMLSELLLLGRITADGDKQLVTVVDASPTGDAELDELLDLMASSHKPKGLKQWVSKAGALKHLRHRVAKALCDQGILRADEGRVLWVFTKKIYPELDGSCEDAIRARMERVLFTDQRPDERTAVLIAFAKHCHLLQRNFDKAEVKARRERIDQLAAGELLAAGATKEVIVAVQTAVVVAAVTAAVVSTTT